MSPPFFSKNQLRVKICGLKTAEDAQAAVELGADALGFNFYPSSPRFVPPATALKIVTSLPRDTARIAVVVHPTSAEIQALLDANVWDAIQFHGDEPPKFCEDSGFPIWIKALRISDDSEQTLEKIGSFSSPYILLDANVPNTYGGTGTLMNLHLAARIVQAFPQKHFILAGGLRPENVQQAAHMVRPFAVDVASGVENASGRKDLSKMQAFITAAVHKIHGPSVPGRNSRSKKSCEPSPELDS